MRERWKEGLKNKEASEKNPKKRKNEGS